MYVPTQMQPTPTLYGKDAEAVLRQVLEKPTPEQLRKAHLRSEYFASVPRKPPLGGDASD